MRIKFTQSVLISVVVLLIFGSGCGSKIDSDLVGNEKCFPSCWMGIQPGETKTGDAIQLLKGIEANGGGNLTVLNTGILKWLNDSNKTYYLYTHNDSIIKVEIDFRSNSLNLEEVVSLFGEPTNVGPGKISDGGYFISVYYPEKGLAFIANGNKSLYEVYPGMHLVTTYFLHPSDLTKIVPLLYGENMVFETLQSIRDWQGYGKIIP